MSDQDTRDRRRQKIERGGKRKRYPKPVQRNTYDQHGDDLFHDPSDPFEPLDFNDYDEVEQS